jgi:hypothetical protein
VTVHDLVAVAFQRAYVQVSGTSCDIPEDVSHAIPAALDLTDAPAADCSLVSEAAASNNAVNCHLAAGQSYYLFV